MRSSPIANAIQIDSADDPRIDDFRNLTDAELRRRRDNPIFVAEGLLVIRRLLASAYPVRSLLLTEAKGQRLGPDLDTLDAQVPIYLAPPDVLNAIAGFHVHRGALAAAARTELPTPGELLAGARLVVILEGINDHENLGALFRNAAAFGVDAVLLCPRCADPLYRRSVRVSLGHVLHVPFARVEPWPKGLQAVEAAGLRLVALTPGRAAIPLDQIAGDDAPTAILVGAEGDGLSLEAREAAPLQVRIPIAPRVDSLNLATAAAIALHRLARGL